MHFIVFLCVFFFSGLFSKKYKELKGLRVSVTFHFMCVHIISSPEPKAHR